MNSEPGVLAPPRQNRWQVPPIDPDQRLISGTAAALATEIGVQPLVIRVSFVILALAGGWGLLLYGAAWLLFTVKGPIRFDYKPVPKGLSSFRRHLAIGMIVQGLVLALRPLGGLFLDVVVFPVGFVLAGFLIAHSRRQEEGGTSAVIRIVAGVTVAGGGLLAVLLSSLTPGQAVIAFLAAIPVVLGVAVVVTPSLTSIGREFDVERQRRVRADERARVAAHLHDSVLQTLTLIQRHADDPERTARIARRQERELRSWLYGTEPTTAGTTRLDPALQQLATKVEQSHDIKVEVVVVGDNEDLDPAAIADLVDATQEAAVNAAKHAEVDQIDIYAERTASAIEIFVRDAGVGFDQTKVNGDRRGLRDSIVGRMARSGGTAVINSEPGAGTEVELLLPLSRNQPPVGS